MLKLYEIEGGIPDENKTLCFSNHQKLKAEMGMHE